MIELTITNKKYQPVKVFLSDSEAVLIGAKETKKFKVSNVSQHVLDLKTEKTLTVVEKVIEGGKE